MLATLALALVLNVIEVKLVEDHPAPTQPTHPPTPIDIVGPTPQELALTRVVADGMEKTQTDPAAWSHVTQVLAFTIGIVSIQVATKSDAVVERVCEQARRYMYSLNPYGPHLRRLLIVSRRGPRIGLDDKNDACVAALEENLGTE